SGSLGLSATARAFGRSHISAHTISTYTGGTDTSGATYRFAAGGSSRPGASAAATTSGTACTGRRIAYRQATAAITV
ncbi:MAG: hypothetical protein SGJ26_03095, partial [Nitrospirota bacterium]|nr:hypothetical protein [Nitrospirota bacterium]